MAIDVKVPGVGESVQEGMIESWKVATGDWVDLDGVLCELETDKATVEIMAEVAGIVAIVIEEGAVVKVGDVIARIDETAQKPAGGSEPTNTSPPHTSLAAEVNASASAPAGAMANQAGPAATHVAAREGVDLSHVAGSGKGGRPTKGDVLDHAANNKKSSPSTAAAPAPASTATAPSPSTDGGRERQETRKPMTMLRRRIAERLLESQQSAAILTTFNEVDMTATMELRKRHKETFLETHGVKLGFMGFFLKASVAALEAYPSVNAYLDGTDICYHNYCDIGVAVSTKKGLMVPVLRDVDQLTLAGVEQTIGNFAAKARDNKISLDDLSGGTFTVSNGGVFGSLLSTPIINPPQTAILGMHKTQMRPMVMPDGKIEARPMMYLALSYDHRLIDGKEAVGFLVKIKECIEDPTRLLLGV